MATIEQQPEKRITEQELAAWERSSRISLPAEYREFLLQHNGGRPVPDGFSVPGWPGAESAVGDFLGLDPGGPCDLDDFFKEHRDRLPSELLPIAYDPMGNLICIGHSGSRRGEIYYWDPTPDWDLSEGNIFKIADNFDDFVGQLH